MVGVPLILFCLSEHSVVLIVLTTHTYTHLWPFECYFVIWANPIGYTHYWTPLWFLQVNSTHSGSHCVNNVNVFTLWLLLSPQAKHFLDDLMYTQYKLFIYKRVEQPVWALDQTLSVVCFSLCTYWNIFYYVFCPKIFVWVKFEICSLDGNRTPTGSQASERWSENSVDWVNNNHKVILVISINKHWTN